MIAEITDTNIFLEDGTRISKVAFEKWVDNSDKREWELNSSDHNGYHKQVLGKMSWQEYYESDYLKSDVKEFLEVRNPENGKLRSMPDLNRSLKPILEQVKRGL
jgi:hypothetical protein